MAAAQFIPIGQIAADVLVLGDPLTVLCIVGPPGAERVDVEILPVQIDALLGDELIHAVDDPVPGFGIAEVHHAPFRPAEDPLRAVEGQPGAGRRPLGLEPDNQLYLARVEIIADRPEAPGKTCGIGLPRARLEPVGARVPTGVHPPVIELDAFLDQGVEEQALGGFTDLEAREKSAAAEIEHGRERLAVRAGRVVGQHPPPPDILGADGVALIKLQHDQR